MGGATGGDAESRGRATRDAGEAGGGVTGDSVDSGGGATGDIVDSGDGASCKPAAGTCSCRYATGTGTGDVAAQQRGREAVVQPGQELKLGCC